LGANWLELPVLLGLKGHRNQLFAHTVDERRRCHGLVDEPAVLDYSAGADA
jgi:hypothetical protein